MDATQTVTKASTSIWFWIILAIVIYLIWAYYDCKKKSNGLPCNPFVGLEPLINFFNQNNNVSPVTTNTSTGTSTNTSILTTIPDGTQCIDANGNLSTTLNGVCIPSTTTIPDGTPCTDVNGNSGTTLSGVCIATSTSTSTGTGTSTPPTPTTQIKVTNPNGASLYVIQNGVLMITNLKQNGILTYTSTTVINSVTYYQIQLQQYPNQNFLVNANDVAVL